MRKNCPNGHGAMEIKKLDKNMMFRGVNIEFQVEHYVCPVCGIEVGSVDQATVTQRVLADAYRKKVGLMKINLEDKTPEDWLREQQEQEEDQPTNESEEENGKAAQ